MNALSKEEFESLLPNYTELNSVVMGTPKLSVCLITYNHARFISQAIEGVLMQRANFEFELVIGEDCSTDGTRDIVLDYQRKHPQLIRVILASENGGKYTGNGRLNFIRTLRACRGEYVAFLEGDDYWTAPHKLQVQVDHLNANPTHSECFHHVTTVDENNQELPASPLIIPHSGSVIGVLDLLIHENGIPALSMVFRRELFPESAEWIYNLPVADWPLHISNACHGPISCINETMAAYRIHNQGIWSGLDKHAQDTRMLDLYEFWRKQLSREYQSVILKKISEISFSLAVVALKRNNPIWARHYFWKCLCSAPFRCSVSKPEMIKIMFRTFFPSGFKVASFVKRCLAGDSAHASLHDSQKRP